MKNKMLSFFKITFVLSTILLISSSCTKDKWYNDTVMNMVDVDIKQSDWKWDSDLGQFYATVSFPEINNDLLNNGTVNATIQFDNTYVPLPYTYFFTENGKEFTETVSFEYSKGEVVFTVSAVDQFASAEENYKPISKHFVVTTIAKIQ